VKRIYRSRTQILKLAAGLGLETMMAQFGERVIADSAQQHPHLLTAQGGASYKADTAS
jgi:hypothetical protein